MNGSRLDEDFLRHLVLNSVRMYNVKFRNEYGRLVIACDGGSWRKKVFPEYKASRKDAKEASSVDWPALYEIFNKIITELQENFQFPVVRVRGAEADDIIATLALNTVQDFGHSEPVMIVSADKDFIQLQEHANISQFSTATKKLLVEKNPIRAKREHIIRGCGGDGVPNILSDDDAIYNPNKKQRPITKKFLEQMIANWSTPEAILNKLELANLQRNITCIDLTKTPEDIRQEILSVYEKECSKSLLGRSLLSYFVTNRLRMLCESLSDFTTPNK